MKQRTVSNERLAKQANRKALASILAAIVASSLLGWAGSWKGNLVCGIPVFALAIGLAFVIQWIAFVPAFLLQTERFFDITGSLTYGLIVCCALLSTATVDPRSVLLFLLVAIWAARLGYFLFKRVRSVGKDARFDAIKPSRAQFLMTWTLQGLWVSFTLAAALAAMTSGTRKPLGWAALIGALIWCLGFGIEAMADVQKSRFRTNPANKGHFIQTGLWAWSRHPNYFGEIVLWVGIAIIATPVLREWQMAMWVSPVFVMLLLTQVSGVPMLEKRADETWGGRPEYELYKRHTPRLVLRPPRRVARSSQAKHP